jgi:hypothetical protein
MRQSCPALKHFHKYCGVADPAAFSRRLVEQLRPDRSLAYTICENAFERLSLKMHYKAAYFPPVFVPGNLGGF